MSSQETSSINLIFKQLESSSSATVLRSLLELRNKLLKSPTGVQLFRKNNGSKYLFRFVKKPNEKILDTTLSILANLCLDEYFKCQVAEEPGLLVHILSLISHMQKDSIIGRACRLIGNLATSQNIAVKLYQKGAVPKLIESLKSKESSAGTKQMAVRALRLLWEAEISQDKMLQDEVVRTISSLLNTPVDELLQAVLKALAIFTHRCSERCALQVQGDGKGFEELIASIKNCSKHELPVSVILNLCYVPEVRPLLGTAGAIEAVMSLTDSKNKHQCYSDVVSILCLLSRESVNRSKVRRNGGLEVLLDTLRLESYPNLEARTLNAMLHFIYDECGLEILIKDGLVPVLVKKLIKAVDQLGSVHNGQISKACINNSSASADSNHKRIRLSNCKEEGVSFSYDKDPLGLRVREIASSSMRFESPGGQWSPGSSRSVEFSPDTMRTYSPPLLNLSCSPTSSALSPASHFSPPSPLSDAYSPVCGYSSSEDEKPEETDVETVADCYADSDSEVTSPCLKDKDDIDDIQEALNANLPSNNTSRHGLIESWCLLLLSRVSHMDSLVDDMISSSTVDTLLQYYTMLEPPHPRAARILQRITRNHHCLLPLMRAGLVLKVNKRLSGKLHDNCSRCLDFDSLGNSLLSQLSVIAESGFGEGVIVHNLMCAARPVQSHLIVSIPYIIRKKKLLHQMLSCKINTITGLDLLIQLMTDEYGDGMSVEATDSVNHLVQQIGAVPKDVPKTFKIKMCRRTTSNCSKLIQKSSAADGNDLILLKLDNGATVPVKKGELCEESPMFTAMLTGNFNENGKNCVPIKDVSEEYLSVLLSLMRAPTHCLCCLWCRDINFAFEILKLADRFILPKVIDKVANWLVYRLTPDVVCSFYLQAQNLRHVLSKSEMLSRESLHFALSEVIDREKRHEIFSVLLNSDHKSQFIDDLTVLIKLSVEKPS
ncbi:armadillo repeat-containing protein 5 [Frankliniella occidentalis]|uniref:Armadillo repeat-containing protein 5 n=1 Tax=Frankliniella occidentalis TaxID=133901 RepID=A0A6J1T2H6_FRAOC|nr:armadillo repeat-containing protein 5 [Frankliniella occidentalis]